MPIDYNRPDRTRRTRPAPSPRVETPAQQPVANSTPPPRRPSTTGQASTSHASVLETAAGELATVRVSWQAAVDSVSTAAARMLEAFVASHADTRSVLTALDASEKRLIAAANNRYGGQRSPSNYAQSASLDTASLPQQANAVANDLETRRIPFTQKARAAEQKQFNATIDDLLRQFPGVRRNLAHAEWQSMTTRGTAAANEVCRLETSRIPLPLAKPAPPVGPQLRPISRDEEYRSGPGPLNLQIGTYRAAAVEFSSTAQDDKDSSTHTLNVPGVTVPLVVDLDAVGAFLITERQTIEGPIVNLLAALPANRLMLKIFDPEHGGDSAKFLFALEDAAEKIIGERVKTTERDLSDLLQETEEHITFVTQRYLQGEHKTLTAYNRAAGEVAEPYRILVLYDFPSGFTRGGHPDIDQLDRLTRIARNGPRTGIFTIIVTSADSLSKLRDAPQGGNAYGNRDDNKKWEPARKLIRAVPQFSGVLADATNSLMSQWPGAVRLPTTAPIPQRHRTGAGITGSASIRWHFHPLSPPPRDVVASQIEQVRRNLRSADDVRVSAQRVAELVLQQQSSNAATFGLPAGSTTAALPSDETTWWRGNTVEAVVGHFGRIGARGIADLRLDSEQQTGALIGGRPGSGKSVLLHAVIMSIALEYPPDEVDLYLVDFKEGVEFKRYADDGLPHARVIAIESEREFGLSVLRHADAERVRRSTAFKEAGGFEKITLYRNATQRKLPRMVLIIDEFQQLFLRDDKIAGEAAYLLEQVLRLGRAWGVHVILASQSLAGMASLGKHVFGFIPTRIALQCTDSDSRMILSDENSDAQTLTRAGEGILNLHSGVKEHNQRFQAAFWDPEERAEVLRALTNRARIQGLPNRTAVFAGYESAAITDVSIGELIPPSDGKRAVHLPVGMPSTLDTKAVTYPLRREAGANLLLVDENGVGPLTIMCGVLGLQSVQVELIDFVGDDDDWAKTAAELMQLGVRVTRRRGLAALLQRTAATVADRQDRGNFAADPIVLAIAAMGRARDFDPSSYDEESPAKVLQKILRDGPEVGVHVVAWFDKAAGIGKRLDSSAVAEFAARLVGRANRDESDQLIDNGDAATLKDGQAILADLDRSEQTRVRRFATPPLEWVIGLRGRQTI